MESDPRSHHDPTNPAPPDSQPPKARTKRSPWQGRKKRPRPAPPRQRLADVTAPRRRPPPFFPVADALTERDGGVRVCRSTGDRVGKARVLPASEEPDQSKLYGAAAGRGNL